LIQYLNEEIRLSALSVPKYYKIMVLKR
jgi:hypothetical protein